MPKTLTEAFADERDRVTMYQADGMAREATLIAAVLDRLAPLAEPFTRWISEGEAKLRSGDSDRTMRRKFRMLHELNLARYNERLKRREYLLCAIPARGQADEAYQQGRDGLAIPA